MPAKTIDLPSAEYLSHRFSYDPSTGVLVWKDYEPMGRKWNAVFAGKVAGTKHLSGYRAVTIDRIRYLAHRIAFKIAFGRDPYPFVDHINGDRSDNRACNLREADFKQNAQNAKSQPRIYDLPRGVYPYTGRRSGRYRACITVAGKQHSLGAYASIEAAASAYRKACGEMHGEFACVSAFRTASQEAGR